MNSDFCSFHRPANRYVQVTITQVGENFIVGRRQDNGEPIRRSHPCPGTLDPEYFFSLAAFRDQEFVRQLDQWRSLGFPLPESWGFESPGNGAHFDGVINHPLILKWLRDLDDSGILNQELFTCLTTPLFRIGQSVALKIN